MKEIETLVEEKTKESLDVSRLTREGEPALGGMPVAWRVARQVSPASPGGDTHLRHQVATPTGAFARPIIYQLLLVQQVLGLPPHPTHQDCHPDALRMGPWLRSKIAVSQLD